MAMGEDRERRLYKQTQSAREAIAPNKANFGRSVAATSLGFRNGGGGRYNGGFAARAGLRPCRAAVGLKE
jgi:hypothetical protein